MNNKVCNKCGLPLAFKKITLGKGKGKYCPVNLDGTDHWDICLEERMKDPAYKAYRLALDKKEMRPKPSYNNLILKNPYSGDRPPWEYPNYITCIE